MSRPPSLAELLRVFLKISLLGFGGPNAHLALILDEVVERRGWITREHFLQLVGVTNLLPGYAGRPSDPRTPQNLAPVAGLESWLRHRMGDHAMVRRSLLAWLAADGTASGED